MTLLPKDHRKTFWSRGTAERFSSMLTENGCEPDIWQDYDKLNKCHIFIVAWDNK